MKTTTAGIPPDQDRQDALRAVCGTLRQADAAQALATLKIAFHDVDRPGYRRAAMSARLTMLRVALRELLTPSGEDGPAPVPLGSAAEAMPGPMPEPLPGALPGPAPDGVPGPVPDAPPRKVHKTKRTELRLENAAIFLHMGDTPDISDTPDTSDTQNAEATPDTGAAATLETRPPTQASDGQEVPAPDGVQAQHCGRVEDPEPAGPITRDDIAASGVMDAPVPSAGRVSAAPHAASATPSPDVGAEAGRRAVDRPADPAPDRGVAAALAPRTSDDPADAADHAPRSAPRTASAPDEVAQAPALAPSPAPERAAGAEDTGGTGGTAQPMTGTGSSDATDDAADLVFALPKKGTPLVNLGAMAALTAFASGPHGASAGRPDDDWLWDD